MQKTDNLRKGRMVVKRVNNLENRFKNVKVTTMIYAMTKDISSCGGIPSILGYGHAAIELQQQNLRS
jgi:hypothetical protein